MGHGLRSLNPLYLPCVEILFDAHKQSRGIPLTYVQVSHAIDIVSRFDPLQPHHPNGSEMQWFWQLPRDIVRKPSACAFSVVSTPL